LAVELLVDKVLSFYLMFFSQAFSKFVELWSVI